MIVQNEHWYGQPRPASKLELWPMVRTTYRFGRDGTGVPSIPGRSFRKSYVVASWPAAPPRRRPPRPPPPLAPRQQTGHFPGRKKQKGRGGARQTSTNTWKKEP